MKIKFADIKNELLRHCIIHCTTKLVKEKGNELISRTHEDDGRIELTMIANGIKLPVLEWFNRLDVEIDRQVANKAHEIVGEKLNDIEDEFNEIIEDAKERILEGRKEIYKY
jgi:hypothetical protein